MQDDYEALANDLKALAHPTRLEILALLRGGETCVCHMEAALGKRQAYISQQLMILREAGVIDSRKDGRQVFYWIADARVQGMLNALLGPAPARNPVLAGCPCPRCSVVLITEEDIHAQR
jgi:DNA-binding transcriptional ArsR family regulator